MVDLSKKFEHYQDRLRAAMKSRKLTNEALAEKVDAHSVTISKLRNGTMKLDDEWRARLAEALNLPETVLFGEDPLPSPRPFEIWQSPRKGLRQQSRAAARAKQVIQLYGLAAGSKEGALRMTADPIDEVTCPPALEHVMGAYALRTSGESMIPRYFPGDRLYINPHQRVHSGDHVIIQTMRDDNSGTETWVKRFDGEDTENIYVLQYNPEARMAFKKDHVIHMHRVLPINELF